MKSIYKFLLVLIASAVVFTSCFKDLDTIPLDEDIITSGIVYDDPNSYRQVLAKLYGGYALSGQQGPAGQSDIDGIDEGFGQYLRALWYHSEFPTDEALVGWNDQTIGDFHDQDWSADDGFIFAFYSRIFYQIALANEFIRETSDEKLQERGVDANLQAEVATFRAEARFLRALSYWHALDHFRNVPFVTEEDAVGSFLPEQINANDLFNYIESELLDIETLIAPVRTNEYARSDQGAVWMLLAKLYLNAEVYTGTSRYQECIAFCEKILSAGYSLEPNYRHLFLADNHNSNEIIFPITFDGVNTRTWGGMTFIIRAGIGGAMNPSESGVSSGWGGVRTTRQLVEKFPDNAGGISIAANEGNTVQYPKIYIPGSYQGWDVSDTDNSLSSVNSDKIYEGYRYFPDANTGILFTRVPSFGLSLGDRDGDGTLEMGQDTIYVQDPGFYYFRVDLNDNTYEIEKREFGVIGDATPGGWDTDTDMVWDEDRQALVVEMNLVPGEMKFRANDDWAVNYGDTGGEGVLDFDGDNIVITEGGLAKITLFLDKPDYTFEVALLSFDNRGRFFSEGQTLDITDISLFEEGYAVTKFRNITSDGAQGSDTDFPDTDFPMFRLGDVYLMASEAILRGGGDINKATEYYNAVVQRAFQGGTKGNITPDQLNLDLLLDERARELYWECHRRTDLIRFGQFSNGSYVWAWKGGVMEGQAVDSKYDVYPIPSSDLGANPNLVQNEGY